MTDDELLDIAGRAELAEGDVPSLLRYIQRLKKDLWDAYEAMRNLNRELVIYQLAADPMEVAKARKSCQLAPLEQVGVEIER